MKLKFEWDDDKARKNIVKHGIDFDTALHVFYDPDRLEMYDERHSEYEDRYLTIGKIDGVFVIVTVAYTERNDSIRIISARLATKKERDNYYAGYEGN